MPQEAPRWYEAPFEGHGVVTTDLHGDVKALEHVERFFRRTPRIRWWVDLGDKGDVEKRRMEDPAVPPDGDVQVLDRLRRLKRDLARGLLPGKSYHDVLGNHDERDLAVYEALRSHGLLARRARASLSTLLERIARRDDWLKTRENDLRACRSSYGEWVTRLALEDPGLGLDDAALRFYIRVVLCQHGFAMRMGARERRYLEGVGTLAVSLPRAGVVLVHGGVPSGSRPPRAQAEAPEPIRRGFLWNRYPADYGLPELKDFLRRARAGVLVVGHTPPADVAAADPRHSRIERGVAVTAGLQVTFTSGAGAEGARRVFLELDASSPLVDLRRLRVHALP